MLNTLLALAVVLQLDVRDIKNRGFTTLVRELCICRCSTLKILIMKSINIYTIKHKIYRNVHTHEAGSFS